MNNTNNLKPKYRTLLAFPIYEEIGHGGAYVPEEVEEYVALDIGLILKIPALLDIQKSPV